jgi:hypothetical protein
MQPLVAAFLLLVGIPISLFALIALFSALMLLLPGPVRQAQTNLEDHPWRSILLGVLNFTGAVLILVLLFALVGHDQHLQAVILPVIFLVGMAIAIPTVIGLCAAIIVVSARLGELRRPLWTYLRGGGLLLLACLTPLIGWFIFTPLVLWASMGSVIGILVRPGAPKTLEDSTSTELSV